jgi:hypothetical protein
MAVSIEQAGVNALRTYLAAQLPDVIVSDEWPNPDEALPEKAITILKIGAREETRAEPRVVKSEPLMVGDPPAEDPVLRVYTWRVKLIKQTIQLDIWSQYEVVRDDISARLDEALSQGPAVTIDPTNINLDDFRDGILLALGDGHPGFADYMFDGDDCVDEAGAAQRSEFRATRLGYISAPLTIQKTQPKIAHVGLSVTAFGATDTYTLT